MAADVLQPVVLAHNDHDDLMATEKQITLGGEPHQDSCQTMDDPEIMKTDKSSKLQTDCDAAVLPFVREAELKGLDEDTIAEMMKEDFDSYAALKVLDLSEDLPNMDISITQQAILRRWVEDLVSLRSSGEFSFSSLMKSVDDSQFRHDDQKYHKNLKTSSRLVKDILHHVKRHNLTNFASVLSEKVCEFKNCEVNVCVVGDSYVGKSSFIHTLVNKRTPYKEKRKMAGLGIPYCCSDIPGTVFWDLPDKNWRDAKNNQDPLIRCFDAMIICSSRRFSEADLALAKMAAEEGMPVYYVRTKFDVDVFNEKRERESDFDENQLIIDVKSDIVKNLALAELCHTQIYVLSSKKEHRTQWEFPKLKRELITNPPMKNVAGFLKTVLNAVRSPIEKSVETLRSKVQKTALKIVKSKKSRDMMKRKVKAYRDKIGLEMSTEMFDDFDIQFQDVEPSKKHRWLWVWCLGIGFLIGLIIDIIVTHNQREKAIEKCQRQCEALLSQSLDTIQKEAQDALELRINEFTDKGHRDINCSELEP